MSRRHDRKLTQVAYLAIAIILGPCGTATAQVATASINGTVRDSSGAVVPEARLVLHNLETGVEQVTRSNDTGSYVLLQIPPGTYSLAVAKEGFNGARLESVALVVNQTTTFDFVLAVGSSAQSVTVQETAGSLETSTAGLGVAIVTREVNDLPLNGRNFTQLLALTPSVSVLNVSQNATGTDIDAVGAFAFPSVSGQTNRSNMFLMDGLNDLSPYKGEYTIGPILDDIREFKIDSHNDQVQFGGVLGGVVNVVTKSGTNTFHGTLWEFVRNQIFDARNPFFAARNPLRQNQFGANVGGPVELPHYNGKNRTFFFGSYEGLRRHAANQVSYLVPTPTQLQGNFGSLSSLLYDPFSTRPDPNQAGKYLRDPFPNNTIPSSQLDANMVRVAQTLFPAPVSTGIPGQNGEDLSPTTVTSNQYNIRLDEQLNQTNSVSLRFSHMASLVSASGGIAGLTNGDNYSAHQFGGNWTHTFGPSAVLQVRFARNNGLELIRESFGNVNAQDLIKQTGISPAFSCGFQNVPVACLIPNFTIPGYLSGGEQYTDRHLANIWEGKADLSLIRGKHTLSVGADFTSNNFNQPIYYGTIGFNSFETSNLESPSGTGNALASFLLGVPDNANLRAVNETTHGGWVDGFYVQDQWKLTDRLTINLGLRYDVTLWPVYGSAADGNQFVGDYNLNNGTYILARQPQSCSTTNAAPCIPGGQLPANVVVTPYSDGRIIHNTHDNIQPRGGIAYRLGDRTVLRTSFGRFYDNWAAITQIAQNYNGTWPSIGQQIASNLNATTVTVRAESPFGSGILPAATPFGQVSYFVSPYYKNAYSDQWNFGVQREISSGFVVAANYLGSHDSRLDLGSMQNTAQTPGPGTAATVASRRPFPYITPTHYDQSIGRSSYNALQVTMNRKAVNGLAYLFSYTYSKSLDISCSGFFGSEGCADQNPYNLNADRSVSGFDMTHVLAVSWLYKVPFGAGRFASSSKYVNYVIGGWGLNGVGTITSGQPYYVCVSGDIANTGNSSGGTGSCYERLNLVGDPNLASPTPAAWFNKAAFAVPAPYTFGNLGRNSLRADWFKNVDFSIFREFAVADTRRVEFRGEMFNLTNSPTWGLPDTNINDPNFARVTTTRSTERQIQLSLKFYF